MTTNTKKTHIVLSGGGSAGHVMPNLALLPILYEQGWFVSYIGSCEFEKKLVTIAKVPFYQIVSGKLRRYVSLQNIIDVFKVIIGIIQSLRLLHRLQPDLVFTKGGFVSVPVAVASWILRIPIITHESDLTPGLATKIIAQFADKIAYNFSNTHQYLSAKKSVYVGNPIRKSILSGRRDEGLKLCNFDASDVRLIILVIGGSLGAKVINEAIFSSLSQLQLRYRIIHITGKGKSSTINFSHNNYISFEFIGDELAHIYAVADIVISRAGANTLSELLALRKAMILIPLVLGSRGDQVDNANYFASQAWATVLSEQNISQLVSTIDSVADNLPQIHAKLKLIPENLALFKLKNLFKETISKYS